MRNVAPAPTLSPRNAALASAIYSCSRLYNRTARYRHQHARRNNALISLADELVERLHLYNIGWTNKPQRTLNALADIRAPSRLRARLA